MEELVRVKAAWHKPGNNTPSLVTEDEFWIVENIAGFCLKRMRAFTYKIGFENKKHGERLSVINALIRNDDTDNP